MKLSDLPIHLAFKVNYYLSQPIFRDIKNRYHCYDNTTISEFSDIVQKHFKSSEEPIIFICRLEKDKRKMDPASMRNHAEKITNIFFNRIGIFPPIEKVIRDENYYEQKSYPEDAFLSQVNNKKETIIFTDLSLKNNPWMKKYRIIYFHI